MVSESAVYLILIAAIICCSIGGYVIARWSSGEGWPFP